MAAEKSWDLVTLLGNALRLLPEGAVLDYVECHNNSIVQRDPGRTYFALGIKTIFLAVLIMEDDGTVHRRTYEVLAGPVLRLYDEITL